MRPYRMTVILLGVVAACWLGPAAGAFKLYEVPLSGESFGAVRVRPVSDVRLMFENSSGSDVTLVFGEAVPFVFEGQASGFVVPAGARVMTSVFDAGRFAETPLLFHGVVGDRVLVGAVAANLPSGAVVGYGPERERGFWSAVGDLPVFGARLGDFWVPLLAVGGAVVILLGAVRRGLRSPGKLVGG